MQLSTAQNRREEEEAGAIYRGRELPNGALGPSIMRMVLSFLRVSAVIWYVFVLLTALAANSLRAYCAVLFVSSHLPSRSALHGGPKLSLGSPAPAQHHKRPPNCRNFLLNCGQRFLPRGRYIITKLHRVTAQNTVTFQQHVCCTDD